MKTFQDGKSAKSKKLKLTDGHKIALLTAQQIADMTGKTKSHAYRWIKYPDTIPKPMLELLHFKALGAIPGFPPGWYVTEHGIQGPKGEPFTAYDLENFGTAMTIVRNYDKDVQRLQSRIEWLNQKLAIPPELRKQYGKAKVIQFKHHQQPKDEKQIKEG